MKIIAVKCSTTNSRNDDVTTEWFFCDDEDKIDSWEKEKEVELNKWNYHTAGAMSMRYNEITKYTKEDILSSELKEFETMKVGMLLKLIL